MERIKLFTHTDLDGISCAILAKIGFGDDVSVEYCGYDNVNEKVKAFFDAGLDHNYYRVYITDISISEELAEEIDKHGYGNWCLLDHHATALGLNKFGWCYVEIESDGLMSCGTWMFYKELDMDDWFVDLSYEEMQRLYDFVKIVRAYDTWRWKELGDGGFICKKINDLFYMLGRDEFIDWINKKLFSHNNDTHIELADKDLEMLDNRQKSIDRYIEKKDEQLVTFLDKFGHLCGLVFAEKYVSELGNRLSEMHPELEYIAMIDMAAKKVSYRTVHNDIDLGGEIAHAYGGGGHAKAAGSTFGEDVWFGVFGCLFGGVPVEDVEVVED